MRGPLPNPDRRRRNAPTIPTTELPAGGYRGTMPSSPYRLGVRGRAWWKWAWRTPQAAAWGESARYVVARRALLEDLLKDEVLAPEKALREMRELDDRLGLTPKSMEQLRWKIVVDAVDDDEDRDEVAQRRAEREARLGA